MVYLHAIVHAAACSGKSRRKHLLSEYHMPNTVHCPDVSTFMSYNNSTSSVVLTVRNMKLREVTKIASAELRIVILFVC